MQTIKIIAGILFALSLLACKDNNKSETNRPALKGACVKAYEAYLKFAESVPATPGISIEDSKKATYDTLLDADDEYCKEMYENLKEYENYKQ